MQSIQLSTTVISKLCPLTSTLPKPILQCIQEPPYHIVIELSSIFFFENEHAKNGWSLDSCTCLQSEQWPSMSIPQALSLSTVGSLFKIANQVIIACFGTTNGVQINLCQASFSFLGLISLHTSAALYVLWKNFHCSLPSFHSMNLYANVLSFNNFSQRQLLLCVSTVCHKLLSFKTYSYIHA